MLFFLASFWKTDIMRKLFFLTAFAVTSFTTSRAQSAEETAVGQVIAKVFKAMELGDSAMLHSTFYNPATGATVFKDKTGSPVLRLEDSMNDFYKAVGTAHKEKWYEETWNLKVAIDGNFAQAWCDYAFYVDKNFSHCGIDAFHLFKTKTGEWKIFHLADTRRKDGCDVPQEIKDRRTK